MKDIFSLVKNPLSAHSKISHVKNKNIMCEMKPIFLVK